MSDDIYEVYAIKYAERADRVRADSFLFDDHTTTHPIDYYLWVIRNDARTIVVDTGYEPEEGARRGRPVFADPSAALAMLGVEAERVETVVITHMHYDHAGALPRFPAARFHLQAAEMAFVTGPCMCAPSLRHPFTAEHVCEMVRNVYSGRVAFHDGDAAIAPGVEALRVGGHTGGLQALRVRTARGPLVLASDVAHFYENYLSGKLFPIVIDAPAMLAGHARLRALEAEGATIVPGHDPLVRALFPRVAGEATGAAVHRLDVGPSGAPAERLGGPRP